MLSRSLKEKQVSQLSSAFDRSRASFLVNCIGLNVDQVTQLRKDLKKNKGGLQVIRNTLSLHAMKDHQDLKKVYEPHLEGPNAFVLAFEDPAPVAKVLNKFSGENEVFQIKMAVLDGKAMDKSQVKTLAELPSLEVLKAQFLGLLQAPMQKFLSTVKEVPEGFARVLSAKKDSSDKS